MRARTVALTILRPLAIGIVLAIGLRAAFFRVYAIPTGSMAPTLQPGDQIVVTPYRAPFEPEPRRGDVVVFRSPTGRDELLVKRVIAVPGDLIETRNGRVVISGHALAESYVLRPATTGAIGAQIVPHDCYFVAGDNRENSWDSRAWGVLPRDLISGRARLVLWSWGDGAFEPHADASPVTPGTLAAHPRLGRFFRPIE